MEKKSSFNTYKIAFVGMMAAVTFVVTYFRFPLLGSKVHFANAMCLLSGLLFGPLYGGLAAGLGSGLYDLLNGYGPDEALITFVSKFAMAFVCAVLAGTFRGKENKVRIAVGSVVGAWTYVALYMLKTYVKQRFFVEGAAAEKAWAAMASKLPASAINAVFAMIAAPLLYAALRPALKKAGILERLR